MKPKKTEKKAKASGRVYLSKGLSVDPVLADEISKRAAELRMSWSEYLCRCAEAEISRGGAFKIDPKRPPGEF
jgi:hypothetical protein